jgi:hypothetical protein
MQRNTKRVSRGSNVNECSCFFEKLILLNKIAGEMVSLVYNIFDMRELLLAYCVKFLKRHRFFLSRAYKQNI